jgi:hypothetical protein
MLCHNLRQGAALCLQPPRQKFRRVVRGKRMLAPPGDSQPFLRWPEGHCQYPVDQVPPRTSFKPRQRAECASTCCHASHGSRSHIPTDEGSGAATRPAAPDPASPQRMAPVLPCVPWLHSPPPCSGGLRCCHASRGSGARLPTQEGTDAAMRPTVHRGP